MKAKHVITTFAFAAAMTLGVVAGVSKSNARVARADSDVTVYCAIDTSTLGSYTLKLNAKVGNDKPWVTTDMSLVDDTTSYPGKKVYKATFTEYYGGVDVMQFQLYEGSAWKAQDETINSWVTTDQFSGKLHIYGGSANSWAAYTEPTPGPVVTTEYYYSVNSTTEYVKFGPHNATEVKSEEISLAAGDVLRFKSKVGDVETVLDNVTPQENTIAVLDGGLVTVDQTPATGKETLYFNFTNNTLWAGQYQVSDGLYLYGTHNTWSSLRNALPMNEAETGTFVSPIFDAKEDDIAKVVKLENNAVAAYYNIEGGTIASLTEAKTTVDSSGNIKFTGDVVDYQVTVTNVVNDGDDSRADYRVEDTNYVIPAENGYYLVGTKSSWTFDGATKLGDGDDQNYAKLLNYSASAGEEFKVKSYFDGAVQWFGIGESGENYVVGEAAKTVDVFASKDGKLYVADVVTYTVEIAGIPAPLVKNPDPEKPNELMTDNIALEAGSTVKVLANGVEDTDFEFKHIGNNNYVEATGKVLADAVARVYVDISAKTIFVGGLDFGGYHLLVNGEVYHKMTHNETPDDPRYLEYFSQTISFAKDDSIRFIDTSSASGYAVLFDITTINEYSVEGFEVVDGVLTANKAVNASVYLKLNADLGDEVYLGTVSEALQAAINFAKAFNTAIEGVCNENIKTSEITDEYKLAVKTAWNAQKAPFEALEIEESRTILREATALHSVEDLAKFAAKYDSIFALRGAEYGLEDFAGRAAASSGAVVPMNNNNAALIIVVSIIAGVSLVGLSTLLILKKKHK